MSGLSRMQCRWIRRGSGGTDLRLKQRSRKKRRGITCWGLTPCCPWEWGLQWWWWWWWCFSCVGGGRTPSSARDASHSEWTARGHRHLPKLATWLSWRRTWRHRHRPFPFWGWAVNGHLRRKREVSQHGNYSYHYFPPPRFTVYGEENHHLCSVFSEFSQKSI